MNNLGKILLISMTCCMAHANYESAVLTDLRKVWVGDRIWVKRVPEGYGYIHEIHWNGTDGFSVEVRMEGDNSRRILEEADIGPKDCPNQVVNHSF